MADQILQARQNGQSSDLGVINDQGNINLAVRDEDANITLASALTALNGVLSELGQKLEPGDEVSLPAATVADLKNVVASVSGVVTATIDNLPSDYPLPASQVQTDALTDSELRASPVSVTVSNPTADPETGLAKEATLNDLKRAVTDYEARMEYDGSDNLVYVGKASQGTATSAGSWIIQKLEYSSGNLTRVQVLAGAWDDRATLGWT